MKGYTEKTDISGPNRQTAYQQTQAAEGLQEHRSKIFHIYIG